MRTVRQLFVQSGIGFYRLPFTRMSSGERFPSLTEEDFDKILKDKDSQATHTATKFASDLLRSYLKQNGLPVDSENSSSVILAPVPLKFYAEMRNKKGELCKRSSLLAIRNGLVRHLTSMDIIKDPAFKNANQMFLSMVKKTSKEGKGEFSTRCRLLKMT